MRSIPRRTTDIFQILNLCIDSYSILTFPVSSIQEEQKSDYSFLDEDQYQNMNKLEYFGVANENFDLAKLREAVAQTASRLFY